MNQNFQKSSTQINQTSEQFSQSNHTQTSNIALNPHISPVSRVSILKTEEQKEIVRTNIFEPNNPDSNNGNHFTVVTEVIHRNSNIPLDIKPNPSNKIDINFSFNRPIVESTSNQNIQNKTVNINMADTTKIKSEESYKLLIKRIAMQLKNKIKPPTHGFFYFALQKGQYPLVIIKKLEEKILNHTIELNSDIFNVYIEKYLKYWQLVKKIAHLIKANMKQMFWESERYKNQSIQVKVTNKNINVNMNTTNNKIKSNVPGHINVAAKKNMTTNKNNIQNNKKVINVRTTQVNNTTSTVGNNINNNAKKIKSHNLKSTNVISNNRNNINNQNINQNNLASHRLNPVINPFNDTAKIQNQIHKKINFPKKIEQPNNKNNLFNNKQIKGKNVINNVEKNEQNKSASSETNKTGKIKFNNHFDKLQNNNKEMTINNSVNDNINISNNISERTQIITLGKKNFDNNITTNNINVQNLADANNDIEMKDESNKAYNINQEINNNINIEQPKKSLNMKLIPSNSNNEINTLMNNNNFNNNNSNNIITENMQSDINKNNNNESIVRINDVKKISFDSIKSPGKKLTIKLSAFKKSEDIPNTNIVQTTTTIHPPITVTQTKIDINSIEVPSDNSKITDEHISFVNKFNVLLSSNGIMMEYNIPMAENDEGKHYLKKNEFWEKFVNYVYINYLIDKKNKLSMFSFLHLIEQYFLWCEFTSSENAKEFKLLLIDVMNKVFTQKEIKQFLLMNKMNNLEELFSKYEIFIKYGNKNIIKKIFF